METTTIQERETTGHQSEALSNPAQEFIVYVRSLQLMKHRLRGIELNPSVHIDQKEIEQRFFVYPHFNRKAELAKLVEAGELDISEKESEATGRNRLEYKALRPGAINLYMLKRGGQELGERSQTMRSHLQRVTLKPGTPSTDYFDAFLKYRHDLLELFFKVCEFAGRIHTPITNFHKVNRPGILLDGQQTTSFDVAQMQPTLLGKILKNKVPDNEFSYWIDTGNDIYEMIAKKANLPTRDAGKKRFYEMSFGRPSNDLAQMFGGANWIEWINLVKSVHMPENPKGQKRYNNLAFLLSRAEVGLMRNVWTALIEYSIPFLSVHDEIIVRETDRHLAESLMRGELDKELYFYKLNNK